MYFLQFVIFRIQELIIIIKEKNYKIVYVIYEDKKNVLIISFVCYLFFGLEIFIFYFCFGNKLCYGDIGKYFRNYKYSWEIFICFYII